MAIPVYDMTMQANGGKLIVLRGNAGSGKSTVAARLRLDATKPTALIEQDYYRHQLLTPWDERASAVRGELMIQDARLLLGRGYVVIIEGVLPSKWFKEIYEAIAATESFVYYLDIPFEETARRHAGRSKAGDFGEEMLRKWWIENDVLEVAGEQRITQDYSLDQAVDLIRSETGL